MVRPNLLKDSPLCPSAQPNLTDGFAFGIIGGTPTNPSVIHLSDLQPVTTELLELTQPAQPTEVFRFTAPCAKSSCIHFDGSQCQLVTKIVEDLDPVAQSLAPCHLRPSCRWWLQEGKDACLRCPQIVTDIFLACA